ncbi:MAG: hypothetical protein KDK29_09245 [Sedimentitalea sp.]|nr:hypothetical protein [Sedimentitalea sp.]
MTEALELLSRFQIFGGVLLAGIGWLANQFFKRRQERRVWRLDRLDAQIRNFHGPLFAEVTASDAIWQAFRDGLALGPGAAPDAARAPELSEAQQESWRRCVREVFMPINLRIEKILLEETDLLDGAAYPQSFRDFLAHLAGYKLLLVQWEAGDLSRHVPATPWPERLLADVTEGLARAQEEQQRLRSGLGVW